MIELFSWKKMIWKITKLISIHFLENVWVGTTVQCFVKMDIKTKENPLVKDMKITNSITGMIKYINVMHLVGIWEMTIEMIVDHQMVAMIVDFKIHTGIIIILIICVLEILDMEVVMKIVIIQMIEKINIDRLTILL